jgi:enoyl-CoA hydratase/carnithine racemase
VSILTVTEPVRGYHHVVIDNPPLNLFDPELVAELAAALNDWQSDETVKVVVFESGNPDFFMAHVDLVRSDQFDRTPQPATGLALWPDVAARFERAPFPTISVIRGRARGVGSEFALATDVRFASREKAGLCQPEVGFGFTPGGVAASGWR